MGINLPSKTGNWHGATGFVCFGRGPESKINTRTEILKQTLASSEYFRFYFDRQYAKNVIFDPFYKTLFNGKGWAISTVTKCFSQVFSWQHNVFDVVDAWVKMGSEYCTMSSQRRRPDAHQFQTFLFVVVCLNWSNNGSQSIPCVWLSFVLLGEIKCLPWGKEALHSKGKTIISRWSRHAYKQKM